MKIANKLCHITFLFHFPIKIGEVYLENIKSMRQFHILKLLDEKNIQGIKTISRKLGLAQNTTSELVWRMQKTNIVKVKKGKNDRRKSLVEITNKGKEVLKNKEQSIDKAFEDFFNEFLSREEARNFEKYSDKLYSMAKKVLTKMEEK